VTPEETFEKRKSLLRCHFILVSEFWSEPPGV
jgi:hypothetical protein